MSKVKTTDRTTMTISVDDETKQRLKVLAQNNHLTVSAMITAWAWHQPVLIKQTKETYADE